MSSRQSSRCPTPSRTSPPRATGRGTAIASIVWNGIRLTRGNPPGAARSDDDRRTVYRAALQQFEELFESANSAGPASRPLPLFYALSQAGRAIAAARAGDDWNFHGHGLTLAWEGDLLHRCVKRQGRGAFGVVADATSSPPLDDPVEVGALWSSLPDLADTPLPDPEWPLALYFWPHELMAARQALIPRAGPIKAAVPLGWAGEDAFIEVLSAYPTAADVTLDSAAGKLPITIATPRGDGLLRSWQGFDEHGQPIREMDDIAPVYRFQNERWLRPSIGSPSTILSPLLTWWALLYAFSIFARYEPAAWVAALDLDQSPIAVHLADALEEAMSAVPHLVLDALLGSPQLAWRPIPTSVT